jgi:hypothetical protein
MAELTFSEVKKWLTENADDKAFKEYLSEMQKQYLQSEDFKNFITSEAGRELYKSELDRVASKAIDTFKAKTMPNLIQQAVDEKVKQLNPEETPEQKRIREQDERIARLEKTAKHEKLSKVAIQKLSALKFQKLADLSDKLIGDDEEATLSNIKMLENGINSIVEDAIKEKLNSRDPNNGRTADGDPNFKDPFSDAHWNVTDQMKLFRENRELYDQLRAKAVQRGKIKV